MCLSVTNTQPPARRFSSVYPSHASRVSIGMAPGHVGPTHSGRRARSSPDAALDCVDVERKLHPVSDVSSAETPALPFLWRDKGKWDRVAQRSDCMRIKSLIFPLESQESTPSSIQGDKALSLHPHSPSLLFSFFYSWTCFS